jgi:hypothetical protein
LLRVVERHPEVVFEAASGALEKAPSPRRQGAGDAGLRRFLMEFLPTVVRAEYRGGHRICLVFNDGVESTVDFSDWLAGPVFEPLKEPGYFERFFLDGGTVAWPNGADIAPETLYERARSSKAA